MASVRKLIERYSRFQWATIIIAILGLLVAFTGIKYQDIVSSISSSLFPKADYSIESLTTPVYLSSDFRLSLSVPDQYFIITSVSLKSDNPYQGNPFQVSISFENKGKKLVEEPNILIYFVDYLYRAWGVWNKSATNDELARGCSLEYHFPPLDQKIVGAWVVFVLLYENKGGMPLLVTYELKGFMVTDVAPQPWWQGIVEFLTATATLIVTALGVSKIIDFFSDRKKKSKAKLNLKSKDVSKI